MYFILLCSIFSSLHICTAFGAFFNNNFFIANMMFLLSQTWAVMLLKLKYIITKLQTVANYYQRTRILLHNISDPLIKADGFCKVDYKFFIFCGYFANVFAKQHEIRNNQCTLFIFHAKFMFYWCSKKINHKILSIFCANADPGAKCCEMRQTKKGARNEKKATSNTRYTLFIFCISRSFSRILR